VGNHGGDFLFLQALPHKAPIMAGVFREIDPLLGQGEKKIGIGRADEQLPDGLVAQAGVADPPGATPIVRSENTMPESAQVKGI
jgi:hypothetical protein